jgi:hypothetical protein
VLHVFRWVQQGVLEALDVLLHLLWHKLPGALQRSDLRESQSTDDREDRVEVVELLALLDNLDKLANELRLVLVRLLARNLRRDPVALTEFHRNKRMERMSEVRQSKRKRKRG